MTFAHVVCFLLILFLLLLNIQRNQVFGFPVQVGECCTGCIGHLSRNKTILDKLGFFLGGWCGVVFLFFILILGFAS